MHSNYTDYKPRIINSKQLTNPMTSCGSAWLRVGQAHYTIGWLKGGVIVTVVWYDFCSTLFFYFTKSNSSHTLIDLISPVILSFHMTLSYLTHHFTFITSYPLSFFQDTGLFYGLSHDKERVSTCTKEGNPHWPDQRQSESLPVHLAKPAPPPLTGGRGGITQGVNWVFFESF